MEVINFGKFTLEEITLAVKKELIKFPFITDDSREEEIVKLLKKDFPTLNSDEIQKNMILIEEYYQKSLDYIVFNRLTKLKENQDYKYRSSGPYDDYNDYKSDRDETIACLRKRVFLKVMEVFLV